MSRRKKSNAPAAASALNNWRNLNAYLCNANEDQCIALAEEEKQNANRTRVLDRIYGRLSVARRERERAMFVGGAE